LKALSAELALSRDLTALEIELSVATDAGFPTALAVPPLALVPDGAEPALPERAAPPSMATAQPDSRTLAIIPATRAAA
jgi:hypothetical protein